MFRRWAAIREFENKISSDIAVDCGDFVERNCVCVCAVVLHLFKFIPQLEKSAVSSGVFDEKP